MDLWQRPYDESNFQWLPSEFEIDSNGKCKIKSYINNLPITFVDIYQQIEKLFEFVLPEFEDIWTNINKNVYDKKYTFKNKTLQIITKIVDRFRPVFSRENIIHLPENKEKITTMLTITTCKRLDLFNQTVNSLLNHWEDLNQIDYFLVVDDNSSKEDRQKMKDLYPFFNFYMKKPEEKKL